MKIISLSWKNIWRNPVRTGVVMAAVTIGIWAMMFILSFSMGMIESYINTSIETRTSHIQLHHPDFIDDPEIVYSLENMETYMEHLQNSGYVKRSSGRIVVAGLVSSANGSRGAQIKGVNPEDEAAVTQLNTMVKEGDYLDTNKRNPILISKGMGRNLGVGLDQHVVLSFQGKSGDFVSGRFRVSGWYQSGNTRVDDMQAIARFEDLQKIAGLDSDEFHEMAIILNDINSVEEAQSEFTRSFPDAVVRNYKEISPDLAIYNEQIKVMLYVVIVVIMIALLFGIINTMLMAVLERQKELGMLMAIGMNRFRVFNMVMAESVIMCVFAAPVGLLIGHLTIKALEDNGIDLSAWASGMEEFGLSAIIKPQLDFQIYLEIVFSLVLTAILAGIYPSIKAVRTKPVEALRKI